MPKITTHELLRGKYVNLRDVELDDADFILSLRTDINKSRFLHPTENNREKQLSYLKHYKTLEDQYYFIITDKNGNSLGTIRLYNIFDNCFTPGSWLMKTGASAKEVIESEYLAKRFAFEVLNLEHCHFDVRKDNYKVLNYHQITGAWISGETELDYLFSYDRKTFEEYKNRISKIL